MSQFVFSLEGVLQHRLRLEREAQRALAERVQAAGVLQEELKRLNDDLVQSAKALRSGHLVGTIDLTYLTAHRRYTADVTRRGTQLMQRLAVAQRLAEEARGRLAEAAKQRRVLEKLREKQESRWRVRLARLELAEAEDVTNRMSVAALHEQQSAGVSPGQEGRP